MTTPYISRVLVLTTALFIEALAAQGSQPGDSTAVESQAVRSFVVPSREIRGIVLDAATGKPLSDA